jgi:hypothetical protein
MNKTGKRQIVVPVEVVRLVFVDQAGLDHFGGPAGPCQHVGDNVGIEKRRTLVANRGDARVLRRFSHQMHHETALMFPT